MSCGRVFCSAAWKFPNRQYVQRVRHPDFNDVRRTLRARLDENIGDHKNKSELQADIDILFEIIGDINMREDEVFEVDGLPHVIDFKSGFGSNEKGNMLRLQNCWASIQALEYGYKIAAACKAVGE